MFRFICIVFLFAQTVKAQQDYYALYTQVSDSVKVIYNTLEANYKLSEMPKTFEGDSTELKKIYQKHKDMYAKSVLPLFTNLPGKTLPDISYTDKDFKNHYLSDFNSTSLILNYNYVYCKPCLDRIDSTLYHIKNKKIKMIVLLNELYRKDVSDIIHMENNIEIGFISNETASLLSMDTGDDIMFLMNKNRRIEYFDGIKTKNKREEWLNFLRTFIADE